MANTAIIDLYDPVRWLVGDNNPEPEFADSILLRAIRSTLSFGQVPGFGLTPDFTAVTPALDPNGLMLLCYRVALGLVAARPDSYSARTRAYSETVGGFGNLIWTLEEQLQKLENGTMFDGWGDFSSWVEGNRGPAGKFDWQRWIRATQSPVPQMNLTVP